MFKDLCLSVYSLKFNVEYMKTIQTVNYLQQTKESLVEQYNQKKAHNT